VFVGVAVTVLGLLAAAAVFLRLYQSELIRRTEAELISQGAFVRSLYRDRLVRLLESGCGEGRWTHGYGSPVEVDWPIEDDRFHPIRPHLDLASDLVDVPAPEPTSVPFSPEPCARQAGRQLEDLLTEVQNITLSGIHVVDHRGSIVATTQGNEEMSLHHRSEIERALEGEIVSKVRHREGALGALSVESIKRRTQMRVFVTMPVEHEGRLLGAVSLVRTPPSILKGIYRNRWVFGMFVGAIVVVALAIPMATAVFVGRPIRRLIEQTRRVAREEDDATEPLERPGTAEVDELSRAFADMAATLEERNEYIRTFARNVSHEFKTPISSIQGTVELLDEHFESMSDQKRQRFLEMLQEDAERMEQLVERLLELARAEVFQPGDASTDLVESLTTLDERFGELELDWEVDEAAETLPMAAETLDSVLSNLLDNAHSQGAGHVEITAGPADDEGALELIVHDDGPGISEGNADKVFEAFFSADRSEGDTGLGLAIVRALMEAHDGSIDLLDSESGAKFRLLLPSACERDTE